MDASPNDPADEGRRLQRALFGSAKRSRTRRFHARFDRICRGDVLAEAWERVESNRGAAGIDGEALSTIEQAGVEEFPRERAPARFAAELGLHRLVGTIRYPGFVNAS